MAAPERFALASGIAGRLASVEGVVAVVLGGSSARGSADELSDIDLGLYYRRDRPPDLGALATVVRDLDDRHEDGLVTALGKWGPWVNGGGWLQVGGRRVDVLYREVERVTEVIEDCRSGRITCDYYLGHPHGFHNYIYLGEIAVCRPLVDPGHAISALKVLVAAYPAAMKAAIIQRYLYDARFMLELAAKPAARGDVFEVTGCLFRVVAALVQVVYAINERYFLNEKGAMAEIATFPRVPRRFVDESRTILARPGETPERLEQSVSRAGRLVASVEALARGAGR